MMLKLFAILLAGCALALPVHSDDALWSLLKTGGQVVLMRHAVTTPGAGDPDGMVLNDCSTQRNLTDEGRAHARRIGEAARARGVFVTKVLSSPWCRCLDTGRLAFGLTPEVTPALGNLFGQAASNRQQVEQLKELVSRKPASGNVVLVSHGSTIQSVTGISPGTGEMVVITPLGGGRFNLAGRLDVPAR
jgi:phosphohistidine phosphatase SixA